MKEIKLGVYSDDFRTVRILEVVHHNTEDPKQSLVKCKVLWDRSGFWGTNEILTPIKFNHVLYNDCKLLKGYGTKLWKVLNKKPY